MQNGVETGTAAGRYVVTHSRPKNQTVTELRCYCAHLLYVYAIPIIYLMFIEVMQQQISICAHYDVILLPLLVLQSSSSILAAVVVPMTMPK